MKNKSRTKEIATLHQGFTLIELLVVISIIALLSVIVLGSIQDARTKAQNTKKNEIARQYLNALELYSVSNNSNYPRTNGDDVCLGYDDLEPCYGIYTGDINVNNMLIDYYPDMPKNDDFITPLTSSFNTTGILYSCNSSTCIMYWILSGNDQRCLSDSTQYSPTGSIFTRCTFDLLN